MSAGLLHVMTGVALLTLIYTVALAPLFGRVLATEVSKSSVKAAHYNLDANGYLQGRLEDLLWLDAGSDELALAEQALALVQKLDPPGVGARDLPQSEHSSRTGPIRRSPRDRHPGW